MGAGLTTTCTLFVLYLPSEGVCPTLNPVHVPVGIQKASSCLSTAPDPFTSKFNERTDKKLSTSCWQSAATQEPLPAPIPATPQQHPTPHLGPLTCGVLVWEGHEEDGEDRRREMVGFRTTLLRAGALLSFFSRLLCSSIS